MCRLITSKHPSFWDLPTTVNFCFSEPFIFAPTKTVIPHSLIVTWTFKLLDTQDFEDANSCYAAVSVDEFEFVHDIAKEDQ